MHQYINSLKKVLEHGHTNVEERSGTGTISLMNVSETYQLTNSTLPLIGTRKIFFNNVLGELLWFLSGSPNVSFLERKNIKFWDKWKVDIGNRVNSIGGMYPVLWRSYGNSKIDQIEKTLKGLRDNPFSRRNYITNIDITRLPDEKLSNEENVKSGKMVIDTCHQMMYFKCRYLTGEEKEEAIKWAEDKNNAFGIKNNDIVIPNIGLSSLLVMRSNDMMVGKPYNIVQYALLTHLFGSLLNYYPLEHSHSVVDSHIYLSHVEDAKKQIALAEQIIPNPPKIFINPNLTINDIIEYNGENDKITEKDFILKDYNPNDLVLKLAIEG